MKFLFATFLMVSSILGSAVQAEVQTKKLVVIGDSISEGYGVAKEKSYPSLFEKKIKEAHKNWQIVNASISGSTSASAPSRVRWQLKGKPDLILLALGANDGLRGLPVADMKKNLREAIEIAKHEHIKVILAGMMMPPNYGPSFTTDFKKSFSDLAKEEKIKLIPFLLNKVAGISSLNQSDGIHPNEKGHEIIAETVFNFLKDQL